MGDRNYRAKWHDYTKRAIYHFTLMKSPEIPPFGRIAGDYKIPVGEWGSPYVQASPIGIAIKASLREIPLIHPALELMQYALMPDHLHLIVFAKEDLDEIIGRKIGIFKNIVNTKTGMTGIFQSGFNDQILKTNRNLNDIFSYLKANPYRLAVRQANPDFFQRLNNIQIGETVCQAYGNIHLLSNPFKEQVVVHRRDDPMTFGRNLEYWLHNAANGGVLVSPFISEREKAVFSQARELGGRFILINGRAYREREKPERRLFDLCAQGRLLIISPMESLDYTRAGCLKMNDLAARICAPSHSYLR